MHCQCAPLEDCDREEVESRKKKDKSPLGLLVTPSREMSIYIDVKKSVIALLPLFSQCSLGEKKKDKQ